MAKLPVYNNALETLKVWAANLKGITFNENMQSEVRTTDATESDLLVYDGDDKLWKNSRTMSNDLLFSGDLSCVKEQASSITSGGTTQSTATEVDSCITNISSGTGGIVLPEPTTGQIVYVHNTSSATINIYPPSGSSIANETTNTPITIARHQAYIFKGFHSTNYHVYGWHHNEYDWTSYTPTLGSYATGDSAWAGAVQLAKYQQIGQRVVVFVYAIGAITGSSGGVQGLYFKLPVSLPALSVNGFGGGCCAQSGTTNDVGYFVGTAVDTVRVNRIGTANYASQAGFYCVLTYQANV